MMRFERVCANLGFCHTLYYYHTNAPLCHTERSEVSKHKGVALQNHLDSSVASLP